MSFITDDFVLTNDAARKLFHEHAADMPIYDYQDRKSTRLNSSHYS